MEGFASQVEQQLIAVRELFGSAGPLGAASAGAGQEFGGSAPTWSGGSAQGHAEAVAARGHKHAALSEADAALDRFRQAAAADAAAARDRMDRLIAAVRASVAEYGQDAGSVPAAAALASSLAGYLREAAGIVAGEADRVSARGEELAALSAQFAAAARAERPAGG